MCTTPKEGSNKVKPPNLGYTEINLEGPSRVCGEVLTCVTRVLLKHPPKQDSEGGMFWPKEATELMDKLLRERLIALFTEHASRVEDREMATWVIRQMVRAGLSHTEVHVALALVKARCALGYTRIEFVHEGEEPSST